MKMLIKSFTLRVDWTQQLSNGWQALWQHIAHRQSQPAFALPKVTDKLVPLTLRTARLPGQAHVIYLAVEGELNRHTYLHLIETANLHYQQGSRWLLLDLSQTTRIELSGLFALLSLAQLYSGQALLDPETGWEGLHRAAEKVTPALGERVKLIAPSPVAVTALARASFCRYFLCYPELDMAMRSVGE